MLRLSAAWWVACLLLNMMTFGDQSGSCNIAGVREGYVGGGTYLHEYILLLPFSFSNMAIEGEEVKTDNTGKYR